MRTHLHHASPGTARPRRGARSLTGLLAMSGAAVLSVSVLTGCQLLDDLDKDDTATSPSARPSESAPATRAPSTRPTGTSAPTPSAPSTARPATTFKDKRLVLGPTAGGFVMLTGDGRPTDVPVDPGEIRDGVNKVVVAAYSSTAAGARTVLFVGVDGQSGVDGKRLEHLTRGMIDHVNGSGGSVPAGTMTPYPAGVQGGTLECMPADEAQPAAICGWADRYTTAVAWFSNLSADSAAVKFREMRADLEK